MIDESSRIEIVKLKTIQRIQNGWNGQNGRLVLSKNAMEKK